MQLQTINLIRISFSFLPNGKSETSTRFQLNYSFEFFHHLFLPAFNLPEVRPLSSDTELALYCESMATITDAQIDALANHLVSGLIERGSIKPKVSEKDLVACVVELMSSNFEAEAKIDDEADRMAEEQARLDPRLDVTRLRGMIRSRLAEKKGFTL